MRKMILEKIKKRSLCTGKTKKECITILGDWLLCGGITRKEYKEIRPVIDQKKRETLFLASVMCSLMFAGLLIAGFYSPTLKDAAAYYGIMAAVCIFIAVLSATTVKKHLWLALWLWYVMYVCFGGYAVLRSTHGLFVSSCETSSRHVFWKKSVTLIS